MQNIYVNNTSSIENYLPPCQGNKFRSIIFESSQIFSINHYEIIKDGVRYVLIPLPCPLEYGTAMAMIDPYLDGRSNNLYLKDVFLLENTIIKHFDKLPMVGEHPYIKKIQEEKLMTTTTINTKYGLASLPPRQFILRALKIEKGTLTCICGTGQSAKTMFLQYLVSCIVAGIKPFGWEIGVKNAKVYHLDQEQNIDLTTRRYMRIAAGLGKPDIDIDRGVLKSKLDNNGLTEMNETEQDLIDKFKQYDFVIIDSLKKVSAADENSSDIEHVVAMLQRVAVKSRSAILLIHHMGKSTGNTKQSGRGHSSIYDTVDGQLDLDLDREKGIVVLKFAKIRDGRSMDPIAFRFYDFGEYIEDQDCTENLKFELAKVALNPEYEALEALYGAPLNRTNLGKKMTGDKNKHKGIIDRMIAKGWIATNDRLLEITELGKTMLDNMEKTVENDELNKEIERLN